MTRSLLFNGVGPSRGVSVVVGVAVNLLSTGSDLLAAFQSVCIRCQVLRPTTHSPESSRLPVSLASNSARIPRRLRLLTLKVTGETKASEGSGTSPPMLISMRIVPCDKISKSKLGEDTGNWTCDVDERTVTFCAPHETGYDGHFYTPGFTTWPPDVM